MAIYQGFLVLFYFLILLFSKEIYKVFLRMQVSTKKRWCRHATTLFDIILIISIKFNKIPIKNSKYVYFILIKGNDDKKSGNTYDF